MTFAGGGYFIGNTWVHRLESIILFIGWRLVVFSRDVHLHNAAACSG